MQTGVYVSTNSTIEDRVFFGPYSTLLNDKYMMRKPFRLKGPTIMNSVSVGGGAILMPGITLGEGAVVGAGSLVLKDVPPKTIYVGVPAKKLGNVPIDWRLSKE
jgi:acetyltransferase-like isoleucine patch superfamily enzyme